MPVYLFTYHAYRTWNPDHRRGYTKRKKGYQPADPEMARRYEERAKHDEVLLDADLQRALIDECLIAATHQRFHLHAVFTEPSHLHALVSWREVRGWMRIRSSLKSSLSRKLKELSENERDREHLALSRGANRKQVKHRKHFDHLKKKYLLQHGGSKWTEDEGFIE